MDIHNILQKPVLTEKSTLLKSRGFYTFIVAPGANKIQIKQAVQRIYNVKVNSVKILNKKPREKSMQFGRIKGMSPARKKALVKLSGKETIAELEV
ncbi:MAG TPA: 50S ribosomal protein L23 [Spirochaetota bacterium]|nr:50S ribosomal protein L23 [Spirochaetota bacterium]